MAIEPALQEFRHGEYVGAQVERHEHPAKNQQDEAREPLKMSNRQAGRSSRARQTDKVLRRDVRHEQGSTDEKPADVTASQKVVFGGSFSPRKIHPDAKHDGEVDPDDYEIQGGYVLVCNRDLRCKQHPSLPGIRRHAPVGIYCSVDLAFARALSALALVCWSAFSKVEPCRPWPEFCVRSL